MRSNKGGDILSSYVEWRIRRESDEGRAKPRGARLCTAKLDENVVRPLEALSAEDLSYFRCRRAGGAKLD